MYILPNPQLLISNFNINNNTVTYPNLNYSNCNPLPLEYILNTYSNMYIYNNTFNFYDTYFYGDSDPAGVTLFQILQSMPICYSFSGTNLGPIIIWVLNFLRNLISLLMFTLPTLLYKYTIHRCSQMKTKLYSGTHSRYFLIKSNSSKQPLSKNKLLLIVILMTLKVINHSKEKL